MDGRSEIFDWTPARGSGRNFGWELWNGPQLGKPEEFLVGNVKVKRLVKRMEMWSGGPKEDVTLSNGWVPAWRRCGMDARWDHWKADCSEVSKPRLFAHTYKDTHTKG